MITSKKPIKWHAEVNYSPDCLEAEARVYLESYARLSCVASPWLKQEKTKKLEKKIWCVFAKFEFNYKTC